MIIVRDESLVTSSPERNIPLGRANHSGVERRFENLADPRLGHILQMRLRSALEEALHFRLSLKAAGREARQGLLNDRCIGLFADQYFTVFVVFYVSDVGVSGAWKEGPISPLDPRLHFLNDLTPVLLSLQLSLCSKDRFRELCFRRLIIEAVVGAGDRRVQLSKGLAQLNVELGVTGETFEVVKDYHMSRLAVLLQVAEKIAHPRAGHEVSRASKVVGKHSHHLQPARCGIRSAKVLLAVEA